MSLAIKSGNSTDLAKVNSDGQLEIKPAVPTEIDGTEAPAKVGGIRFFSENDAGTKTGAATLKSPYTDPYYRIFVANAQLLDSEFFTYVAQNTGKHTYTNSTMTAVWSAAGLQTNGTSITTINTGLTLGTYAMFPILGNMTTDIEISASFTQQPPTDTLIDFGLFQRGAATAYAPLDGVYFRLSSAGIQGIINSNGTETATGVTYFDFTYVNNQKYKFYIAISNKAVEFYIDDVLYADLATPIAQGMPCFSTSLPFSVRHAVVGGAAGSPISMYINNYPVISEGTEITDDFGTIGNRIYGSYQGLSGGTMGSLASYANSANPTAAVPTNTTSTVLTALGGQGWETDTLAVNTDGIIMSYQIPAGSALVQGKRLKVRGIKIDSFVQTALTGGGYNAQFALCFGHTNVSLATTEAATAKAPRRIALGAYSVAAAAAVLTQFPTIQLILKNPIYVNPGEFIAIAKKKIGTAPSAGVIAYAISLDYSWE